MTKSDLYTFMTRSKLGVLGTVSRDGSPQSALVGIAITPEMEIVFDTVKTSRKYPNLIAMPACSFLVGWEGEQTIQFEGLAEELTSRDLELYQQIYFKTWPECRAHLSWPDIVYFAAKPIWVRYSDFDQNPPLICEFRFPNTSKTMQST